MPASPDSLSLPALQAYWSGSFLEANALIGLNLLGALLLGMLVGSERSYHGRAAGMRTYGLVCMASTALTVFVGFSRYWYGGHLQPVGAPDATRVVQGIVTGVGFLGAGVIMKNGLSISGLTTAASIWAVAAVGVLLGVGLYAAALLLAGLCAGSMAVLHRIDDLLPMRSTLEVTLTFRHGRSPSEAKLAEAAARRGYDFIHGSVAIRYEDGRMVWQFRVVSLDRHRAVSPAQLAEELATIEAVETFAMAPAHH